MGCNTSTNPSVSHVSLLHLPGGGMFWVGLEAVTESATTTGNGKNVLTIRSVPRANIWLVSSKCFWRIKEKPAANYEGNLLRDNGAKH